MKLLGNGGGIYDHDSTEVGAVEAGLAFVREHAWDVAKQPIDFDEIELVTRGQHLQTKGRTDKVIGVQNYPESSLTGYRWLWNNLLARFSSQ